MKQRLGIAQAIMENPDIILFDEPTNALDSDGVKFY
ncbi:ATP-binding cassette domain-containing protein [Clostridium botulinum]|nr:ATP-binding cassette domain-containing protein [Clostridium botulinum]MCS4516104.1 ATP-binding cassette domain-containing protein [Clostridium botulinum]MCS4523188.1 ATP-binding cassette domain-containing protein [Clostridium botulinum]MCS4527524.1 ATP-binding cassette domain-containing protein [Clostridium botulinum]